LNTDPSIIHMILSIKITLRELSKTGKTYKWDKCFCEDCQRNMWGHGYVGRYLEVEPNVFFFKRYRCPCCSSVVTVRPEGYWPRIRSSILVIYQTLKSKLRLGSWPKAFPRQRGQHWLNGFVSLARMEMKENLSSFLDHCQSKELPFFP